MSLDNFKNRAIVWDTVNKDFPQPIQIMQGDVNARTLSVKIIDNGGEIDLTGHSLKLTYQYTNSSNSGFVMIPPENLTKGEFILVIPTEMTKAGVIEANLILLNEDKEQVIVSKNLTFISDNSTVSDLAQEVNNKIDDFTKLLLENMPQVMRSELNNLHAQTDSNTRNIELKANLADVTSLQNEMTRLESNFIFENTYQPVLSGVGGINVLDGKVTGFGTQNYWSHAQYTIAGDLKLQVSFGKSFNTAVTGHIFATDDNNTILASFVKGSGEAENIDNYEIMTPAGTTKLFIQSYLKYKISVDGEIYQSLSESIEKSNTDLKQEIDNELKIYKEINNSNIYNFISRQGSLGGYPENSNKAVLNVKQNGFNSVRVSVAFTSDNVPVLIHDASINRVARNSDGSAISSTINIADITLEQANTYDWGIAARQDCKGMKIPLLSDFLKICSFKSIFPTLEFKPITATDGQLNYIINMVNKYGLTNKTYFTANPEPILSSVNKLNPSINIGFIAHLNSNIWVDHVLKFKTNVNKVRIDMFDTDTPSIDVINYASSKGVGIKVGSAYSLADIVKFTSIGVTEIEVANVAFPATALNEYYNTL